MTWSIDFNVHMEARACGNNEAFQTYMVHYVAMITLLIQSMHRLCIERGNMESNIDNRLVLKLE